MNATNFFLATTMVKEAREGVPLTTVAGSTFKDVDLMTKMITALVCIYSVVAVGHIVFKLN